jgi:hypothetical protein
MRQVIAGCSDPLPEVSINRPSDSSTGTLCLPDHLAWSSWLFPKGSFVAPSWKDPG